MSQGVWWTPVERLRFAMVLPTSAGGQSVIVDIDAPMSKVLSGRIRAAVCDDEGRELAALAWRRVDGPSLEGSSPWGSTAEAMLEAALDGVMYVLVGQACGALPWMWQD